MTREPETKFTFRVPNSIYKVVQDESERNGRSLNSEILIMIEEALHRRKRLNEYLNNRERTNQDTWNLEGD